MPNESFRPSPTRKQNGHKQSPQVFPTADAAEPLAATKSEPGPVLTCLGDIEPRAVSWLWHGRIPAGRITLLAGQPGEGESFITTVVAALGKDKPKGRTATDDRMEWLAELLAQGPLSAAEGEEAARMNGYTDATLRRAKRKLGVQTQKSGFDCGWVWLLNSLPILTV